MSLFETPLKRPLTGDPEDDSPLLCPRCGMDYSHIRKVFTRLGHERAEARIYEGTLALECGSLRRSALIIQIDGECGHSWNLVIQQHKGINYVTTEPIPAPEPYIEENL